jgi:hypothetical protein
MKKNRIRFSTLAFIVTAVFLFLVGAANVSVNVSIKPHVAYGQSASYAFLTYTSGANVNGKPSSYEVTALRDEGRMVNVSLNVTAVPGTSPSLTPTVQQSDDGGVTWYQVYSQQGTTFAAITSTGAVAGLDFPLYGDLLRVHYASSGTGNFTFTDTAKQAQ